MNTLEEIAQSILRSKPTKSVTLSITNPLPIATESIFAAEIMIVLAVTGSITINTAVFIATAGVPYTFKFVDLRNITVQGSAAAAIYYPAFNQFPEKSINRP